MQHILGEGGLRHLGTSFLFWNPLSECSQKNNLSNFGADIGVFERQSSSCKSTSLDADCWPLSELVGAMEGVRPRRRGARGARPAMPPPTPATDI